MKARPGIPVTVLTGFLGSGKTTLLQRLLNSEGGARSAVLINEFGEIGLDHLLVRPLAGPAKVLQNGCICCTVRSDLREGLRDLIDARDRGDAAPFERILVETTGLADPVPILQSLTADPMLRHQLRLANLISTVDGRAGLAQMESHPEAQRQAVFADRLVITKGDLCDASGISALSSRLQSLNPTASVIDARACNNLWSALLDVDAFDSGNKSPDGGNWFAGCPSAGAEGQQGSEGGRSRHDQTIRSFAMRITRRVDWSAFAVWLSAMVHRHGNRILRVKGLLDVERSPGPVLLNVVQNFVHLPVHLDRWPDADRSSRLVFIVQGLEPAALRRSLEEFLEDAAPGRCGHGGTCLA